MSPETPLVDPARPAHEHGTGFRRRWLSLVAAAAVALPLTLTACGGDDDKPSADPNRQIELQVFWWGGAKRAENTQKVLDLYTQKHPNVKFKVEQQPNAGYFDKLATRAGGGDAPDIFQLDDGSLAEYAQRNVTLDLTKYVKNNTIDTKDIPKGLIDYGVVKGKNAGIAAAQNTPGLIYDKTVAQQYGLDEPKVGWTWDQMIAWGEQLSQKSGGKVQGIMDPSADYKALWLWLRQQDKELYTSDGKVAATADDVRRWFDLWADARKRKATPSADLVHTANTGDVTKQLVVTKQAGASFMWSNQLAELQKSTQNALGVSAYPGDPKGQFARASLYWAGSRTTKEPDTVADVINFMVNDPEAAKIQGVERGLASNLKNRELILPTLTEPEKLTVALEGDLNSKFGKAPPVPPMGHVKLRTELITAAELVQYGKADSKQAADDFIAKAKAAVGS
jgi:multiple sugar transport system substrate-binding protein